MTTRAASPPEELTQSVPLDVTATQHGDGRSSWYELSLEQRRDGDRAAWLDDELHPVEQYAHRVRQRVIVHGDDVVEKTLMVRERDVSDLDGEKAVSQSRRVLQRHRFAGGAR